MTSPYVDFLAGCLGGVAGVLVGHPLDTVKVKLQTQGMLSSNTLYRGTLHCLLVTAKKDGFFGLYKGMSSPLYCLTFINAIVFGVYGNVSRYLGSDRTLGNEMTCGTMAGLCQTFVTSPMELVKTRRQLQQGSSSFRALVKGRQLFRGLSATMARDCPAFGSYFVTYQGMLNVMDEQRSPSILKHLLAGGLAGQVSWVIVYPIDVAKTRIQCFPDKYKTVVQTLRRSCAEESWRVLFKGLSPALIRAFPVNGVTFAVVSYTLYAWETNFAYKD
ncbi:Mitochondrial basic amino acids transporter [Halotydeus destructor]|nr:Mitochondrial basic amino acids transporter [Halotydeus destructor]